MREHPFQFYVVLVTAFLLQQNLIFLARKGGSPKLLQNSRRLSLHGRIKNQVLNGIGGGGKRNGAKPSGGSAGCVHALRG